MTTTHDDYPHPIPPIAYLRWKENYFFILMDPGSGVFGILHFNNEPGFNRSRFTCNLTIRGKAYEYHGETPLPADFEMARQLSDGKLTLRFLKPHQHFQVRLRTDALEAELDFHAHFPTFDFSACATAAPELVSFREVSTLGYNLPYNHQQQALRASGFVKLAGETININGSGYRDHSWVMRSDAGVAKHVWCGFVFPERAFGIKVLSSQARPGITAKEGYVTDADGPRALRRIEVRFEGAGPDGMPAAVVHDVTDVYGQRFVLRSSVAGRHGAVPLVSEAAPGRPAYRIVENFCPVTLEDSPDLGIALVEIGASAALPA
ncbi:hypothetical protein GCM10010909_36140 [Acidocella aquatica]|uniref:Uncharacterized protein n=1 Tax=Acidocella aquatica TaxID=1922313 RepID=A0ABQ6AE60_9PROT|nr:hypothetical protein [Acidocella aquatica]GLR68932.1 hypothetical protein GCM10010909_36140 [Acidocella aquatica]